MTTDPEEFTPGLGNRIQTDPEAVAALVERIKEHGIYQSDPIFIDAAALIEELVSERDRLLETIENATDLRIDLAARLAAAEKVIAGAIRIANLWMPNETWAHQHESEAEALTAMYESFVALAAYDKEATG